jgi:hypothetical protein
MVALLMAMSNGCGSDDGGGTGDLGEGGGFLWKPVSDHGSRLVVLLPPQYTGRISVQYVTDANGVLLETGVFSSVGNGSREHFRYSKQGGAYGNNVRAVADLTDGQTVYWVIPVGSQRTTY